MTVSNSKTPMDKRAELEKKFESIILAWSSGISGQQREKLAPEAEELLKMLSGEAVLWHEQEIADTLEQLRHNLEPDLFGHDYSRLVDEINSITGRTKSPKGETNGKDRG